MIFKLARTFLFKKDFLYTICFYLSAVKFCIVYLKTNFGFYHIIPLRNFRYFENVRNNVFIKRHKCNFESKIYGEYSKEISLAELLDCIIAVVI